LQFVYGTLVELQQSLEFGLLDDIRGRREIFNSNSLLLETYVRGHLQQSVNLFPHLTVHCTNGYQFPVDPRGPWWNISRNGPRSVLLNTEIAVEPSLWSTVLLSVDWSIVSMPVVEEPAEKSCEHVNYQVSALGGSVIYPSGCPYGATHTVLIDFENKFLKRMNKALALDPAWLTYRDGVVRGLAEKMHETGDYFAMPILADALQEAGCENELILWHCRSPAGAHAHGSWLVEHIRQS
jgi:hypothetical protein